MATPGYHNNGPGMFNANHGQGPLNANSGSGALFNSDKQDIRMFSPLHTVLADGR